MFLLEALESFVGPVLGSLVGAFGNNALEYLGADIFLSFVRVVAQLVNQIVNNKAGLVIKDGEFLEDTVNVLFGDFFISEFPLLELFNTIVGNIEGGGALAAEGSQIIFVAYGVLSIGLLVK